MKLISNITDSRVTMVTRSKKTSKVSCETTNLIKGFECPCCSQVFESPVSYRDHILASFSLDPELVEFLNLELRIGTKEPPDTPQTALSDCTQNSDLEDHYCHLCDKVCKGQKGLSQHIGKSHSFQKRSWICKICGKGFKHNHALKFHNRQVHEGSTRVRCHLCGKILYNKYALPQHLQRVHYN